MLVHFVGRNEEAYEGEENNFVQILLTLNGLPFSD